VGGDWRVDPDGRGRLLRTGFSLDETLRMSRVRRRESDLPRGENLVGAACVNGRRRQQPEAPMAMLLIVPGEEVAAGGSVVL
jgi:hypothetical protein